MALTESHQCVIKVLAKRLPDMPDEDRTSLLSSVAGHEFFSDQLAAELQEQLAAFDKLPKPSGTP